MRKIALCLTLVPLRCWAQDGLGIGYVLDHPLPVLAAVANSEFTETVGIGAAWLAFDNDKLLVQALQSGDVGIAVGVGAEAFLDGISVGLDLRLIDVVANYPYQNACYLRNDIAQSNASLFGLRAALPYGSAAELAFNAQMQALDADAFSIVRRDLAALDASAALARRETEIACGSGLALTRMREQGTPLLAEDRSFALGLRWFDAVAVTGEFAETHAEVVAAFLKAQTTLDGDLSKIAVAADMGQIDAEAALALQHALSTDAKLGADWFGGGLGDYLTDLAVLRFERGLFVGDPSSISTHIDPSFLRTAAP